MAVKIKKQIFLSLFFFISYSFLYAQQNFDDEARTSAWNAAERQSAEDVEKAISLNYRFDFINKEGISPLIESLSYARDTKAFRLILNWEEKYSPKFSGSFSTRKEYLSHALLCFFQTYRVLNSPSKNIESLEMLLKLGADPLILTTLEEEERLFSFPIIDFEYSLLLIKYGLPVNIRNRYYETFLMEYSFNLSNIQELLKLGADPNITDDEGSTALMYSYSPSCIEALIQYGADVNIKDNIGDSVMHYYFSLGARTVLAKAGADVNAVNNKGVTPLMKEAERRLDNHNIKHSLILELLELGADPLAVSNDGKNILLLLLKDDSNVNYFNRHPNPETVKLFLDLGVDPTQRDKDGDSALSIALKVKSNKTEVKEIQKILKSASNKNELAQVKSDVNKAKFDEIKPYIPITLGVALPSLTYLGLSIYAREGVYNDNLTGNGFGYFNAFVTGFAAGAAATFLPFLFTALIIDDIEGIVPAVLGIIAAPIVGIITGIAFLYNKNILDAFNKNGVLYYGSSVLVSCIPIIIAVSF